MTNESLRTGLTRIFELHRHTLCLAALLLLGLAPIILMAYQVKSNWVGLPYWDEWDTPGQQFESWCKGTLTIGELFGQHNESRKFFPRLLYFALAFAGGWDVRKEMTVLFLEVCFLGLLLWHLLRQTAGSTLIATLTAWVVMVFLCFAPTQFENFLWGVQLEPFFVGVAVVAVAIVNLSGLSFARKTVINIVLAFIATYTFANGMLLWPLALPIQHSLDPTPHRSRILWMSIYLLVAIGAIGCYFIGYSHPAHHTTFASSLQHSADVVHYLILWMGSYLASEKINPFLAGIFVFGLLTGLALLILISALRNNHWRTFYPWVLIGAYALLSGVITAFGRVGLGVQQALESRYRVFSLFAYLSLVGSGFAIYCTHVRTCGHRKKIFFLITTACTIALTGLCWTWSYPACLVRLHLYRQYQLDRMTALQWLRVIPDNPDLASLFPGVDRLRERALRLEEHHLLRLPLISGQLAGQVYQPPPKGGESSGWIDACVGSNGVLSISGWAWLFRRNRPADIVVIGCKNVAGQFKPISVLRTGSRREDVQEYFHLPKMEFGFSRFISSANFPPGDLAIEGWAVDLKNQTAWPLSSSVTLKSEATLADQK